MNPFQFAKVSESIQVLKVKINALNKAVLPDRMKASTDGFNAQRARLSKSVDSLVALLESKDEAKVKEAIEVMHANYEGLEKVFG